MSAGLLTQDKGIYKVYDLFFALWLFKNFENEKDTYYIITGMQFADTGSEHQLCENSLVMVDNL